MPLSAIPAVLTPEHNLRKDMARIARVEIQESREKLKSGLLTEIERRQVLADLFNNLEKIPARSRAYIQLEVLKEGLAPLDRHESPQTVNNTQINNYILEPGHAAEVLANLPGKRQERAKLINNE